ncbi:MAG: Nudix family hydrolase [Candidatus Competibacteraceae bacterium]|nr:Nudix family hydrolase [Candidatus Competibacteraceae bacterium]
MTVVHVAVGVVTAPCGRVLISRRPDYVHQGGLWEFPGGKVEPGEDVITALGRELAEELGIEVKVASPLIRIPHAYPDKTVLLDVWRVDRYQGEPRGLEGQPLDWRWPDDLPEDAFPAANRPIVAAVRLPDRYLITGTPFDRPVVFLERLEKALQEGVRLVQLRALGLPPVGLTALYRQAQRLCRHYQATLLINGSPRQALAWEADGVHLPSRELLALDRRPLDRERWVAASCHDRVQVGHACAIGVDFIVVGPVLPTPSHPGAAVLDWVGLESLTEVATVPVYALGGMSPQLIPQARQRGAQGIAAIRSLWNPSATR